MSKKTFKAILVDAIKREVYAIQTTSDVDQLNKLIGSQTYSGGPRLPNRDGFLVDDEGMLNLHFGSMFFTFEGYPQPLAGSGLLMGCKANGETADVKSKLDEIKAKVKFLTMSEVQAGVASGEWQ